MSDSICDLCEVETFKWYCSMCREYLCNQCKKLHLKSKASRNHTILPEDGTKKQKQQGGESNEMTKCDIHSTEEIQAYCEKCQSLICMDCIISGTHQNHKLSKIANIIETSQKELCKIILESKNKMSSKNNALKTLKRNKTDFSEAISQRIEDVKSRRVKLKKQMDQITDRYISQLQQREREVCKDINTSEKKLTQQLSTLEGILTKCESNIKDRTIKMVRFVNTLKQEVVKYTSCDPPAPLKPPDFVVQEVDIQEVRALFGALHLNDEEKSSDCEGQESPHLIPKINNIEVISTFKLKNKTLVATVSDTKAWFGQWMEKDVALVTIDGQIESNVKTEFIIDNMTTTKSGELFVKQLDGVSDKIKKLASKGRFVTFYTAPINNTINGVTVSHDNYIYIFSSTSKQDVIIEEKLVQLAPNGKIVNTITFDKSTCNFLDTNHVNINVNGDLVLVTLNQNHKYVVEVFQKTRQHRFTFEGRKRDKDEQCYPIQAITDTYGHIIVSDHDNAAVYLLDADGHFLQYILTSKDGLHKPWGLSIDKSGRLWVCDKHNSKVMVVKYW